MPALNYASLEHNSKWRSLPPAPGFLKSARRHHFFISSAKGLDKAPTKAISDKQNKLKEKRAWDLAVAPAKSLPMQALMLYMSGGGVQVFSMSLIFMLLLQPFRNAIGMNAAFAPFVASPPPANPAFALIPQKFVYILCNLLTLAVGLWKCQSLGLLPTGTGDWLAFETRGQPPEIALL
ncbi:DUF1077-domain-containing protein [Pluteus cervinus]|uniref:DUF1077-domain-containing protein n=1 Tax=Pluteus cervinus TaxID=181527 RepID=A0ACD3AVP3_9AGAR|nr:DUF1077-domain-containing protein [Pluteus cervinus]